MASTPLTHVGATATRFPAETSTEMCGILSRSSLAEAACRPSASPYSTPHRRPPSGHRWPNPLETPFTRSLGSDVSIDAVTTRLFPLGELKRERTGSARNRSSWRMKCASALACFRHKLFRQARAAPVEAPSRASAPSSAWRSQSVGPCGKQQHEPATAPEAAALVFV
jgi:hypothetical protein